MEKKRGTAKTEDNAERGMRTQRERTGRRNERKAHARIVQKAKRKKQKKENID